MALDEIVDRLETETTRRTVVKTGAKLAYAAPLVAATMKLSAGGVAAISGECRFTCGDYPNNLCGGTDENTPLNEVCACFPGVDGSTHCGNNHPCDGPGAGCTSDAECAGLGAGYYCGVSCCGAICIPPCGVNPFEAEVTMRSVGASSGIGR